jgi:cullin 1
LEDHVEGVKKFILERQSDLLVEYLKSWTAYSTGSLYCNVIFRYLNQNWIKKRIEDSRNKLAGHLYHSSTASEVYEVNTLALVIWKEHLFDAVKDRLTKKLLELIQKERDGDQIDQNQVAGVIQSYVKLGAIKPQKQLEIYKEDFEVHFINGTKDYYARESTAFISLNGVSAYMKIVR